MTDASSTDKRPERIRGMFDRVAPRYDFMNHLLSVGLDQRWRRRAAAALGERPLRVLDLCAGTGDQSAAIVERGHDVEALDFSPAMVVRAARKHARAERAITPVVGDALTLPWGDAAFDAVTVSFGLRNVADLDRCLVEIARVLRPGGQVVALEFALPNRQPVRGAYLLYFRHLLPLLGRLSPAGNAYRYLRDSVLEFPQREGLTAKMRAAGFADAAWLDLSAGTVCLYRARNAAADSQPGVAAGG